MTRPADVAPGAEQGRDAPSPGIRGLPAPAVAVIDGDGTVLAWADGARQLLGHRAEDVVGRPAARLLASRREGTEGGSCLLPPRAHDRAWTERTGEHENRPRAVVDVRHRDGRVLRLQLEVGALTGADGERCWLLAATDMPDGDARQKAGEAAVRALLDRSPFSVAVWDTRLRCVWLNQASRRTVGLPPGGRPGHLMREALRGFDLAAVDPVMRGVLASGEPVTGHEARWVSPGGGREVVFSSTHIRLERADGTPLGLCTVSMDITQKWTRERMALMSRAARRVGTTLDVMTTAQELTDLAVPTLADYATVDLAESVPLGGEPLERMQPGDSGIPVFRRAGLASIHKGAPESAFARGEPVFVPPESPFLSVLYHRESHIEPVMDTGSGSWLAGDSRRARIIRETGMHSVMMVPLMARGTILGIAVFVRTENVAPYSRDDLLLAEELAVHASLSLDNARRYTRERAAALALQRSLLPGALSGGNAVELGWRYLPSDRHEGVGGDWLDAIHLPGGRIALVVGDVIGHGINAAATMGRLRTAVLTLAALDLPPAELLVHLDEVATQLTGEAARSGDPAPPIVGATCIYAVYDPVTRVCSFARAGHPPPLLVSPDGQVTTPDTPAGTLIGVGLGSFESVDVELPEGSLIVLFTDGLIETRNTDIDAGFDRLATALRRAPSELDDLCSQVITEMATTSKPEDDIALLVARTRVASPCLHAP
ncbi:SpoIIE family protein phosphatase [Streptomyces sp. NBC_01724]|uniref:SpoIIE family protein phosphatase n=1 Tax=unclassified Streptomyces TaxID=2593676 RepID=UPI002E37517C|nr:SpoIIE family protein phosphatase [Streptomyces sp. NBC_01724]WTE55696.1 SpoIIE family protein phosphatase [Streptomyces sp. NBC_01620]